MTDYKFCDLHKTEEGRRQPKENFQTLRIERWQKLDGRNKLFEVKLDVCLKCMEEQITARAQGLGLKLMEMWKTQVWKNGANGKKYSSMMSADEYLQNLREEEKEKEIQELKARAMGR